MFGCSWGTVASAVAYAVAFGLARRDLSVVTHIGVRRPSMFIGSVDDIAG
jgi:hypothetical protein